MRFEHSRRQGGDADAFLFHKGGHRIDLPRFYTWHTPADKAAQLVARDAPLHAMAQGSRKVRRDFIAHNTQGKIVRWVHDCGPW